MSEWRDPCPWRIVEDMGGAFALGLVGGAMFTTGKGAYTAPKGFRSRFSGAWQNTRLRAPRYATNFAAWGFCFSSAECTMIYLRKKEDPINTITAGVASGAVLAARQGRGAMIVSGIFGGIILGVIEGVMVLTNKWQLDSQRQQFEEQKRMMEEMQQQKLQSGDIGRGWGGIKRQGDDDGTVSAI